MPKGNNEIYDFLDTWDEAGIEEALEELDKKGLEKVKKVFPEMGAVIEQISKSLDKLGELSDQVE